jgi:arsenite methyltransferase
MPRLPDGLTPEAVQAAVRERYGAVATDPGRGFTFPVGRAFAAAVGYAPELLAALPADAVEAFAGVACPVPHAALQPGETVVDLGCGAGLDSLVAGLAVGPSGRVIGVDFAPEMVERARRAAQAAQMAQIDVRLVDGCALPLADATADAVVVNGIFNLNPDKAGLLREAWRVLRPGGRLVAAEITLTAPLPPEEGHSLDDWFR